MAHGADKFQLLEDRVSVKRLAKVIWTQVWLHNKWLDVTTNNCDSSFLDVKWKRRHRPQSRQTYAEYLVVRSAAEQQTRNQMGEPGNRPPPRNFQKHFVVVRYSNWLPLLWKYQLVARAVKSLTGMNRSSTYRALSTSTGFRNDLRLLSTSHPRAPGKRGGREKSAQILKDAVALHAFLEHSTIRTGNRKPSSFAW